MDMATHHAAKNDPREVIILGNEIHYFRQRHPHLTAGHILETIKAHGPCRTLVEAELGRLNG